MINLWDHLSGRCPKISLGEFEWKKGTKIKRSSGDFGYFSKLVAILATLQSCGDFGYFLNLVAILATFQALWRFWLLFKPCGDLGYFSILVAIRAYKWPEIRLKQMKRRHK